MTKVQNDGVEKNYKNCKCSIAERQIRIEKLVSCCFKNTTLEMENKKITFFLRNPYYHE